jgi:hypothetical protein
MTRNARQPLASEALVPWLGGPRSRGLSKRLSRSHRRVRRIAGPGMPPAPSGGARKKGMGGEGASGNRGDAPERALTPCG